MEIREILRAAAKKLKQAKIKNPSLETEILLSFILKKRREYILTHLERKLTKNQTGKYFKLLEGRIKGEPVAYLTGHKEFYGLDFMVNKNVLVPRPETELMVDEALHLISQISYRKSHISYPPSLANPEYSGGAGISLIDIGTGSGCIIITLSKILESKLPTLPTGRQVTNYQLLATDISKSALTIASKNAKLHKVDKKIKFIHGNLLSPLIRNSKILIPNSKVIILANLPYVWRKWKNNPSRDAICLKFEPKIALFTGENGLQVYKKLFKQIIKLQKRHKVNITCLLEFDPRQTVLVKKLIKQYFSKAELQIKKDLAGRNRLIIIKNII